ncbi:MAG: hypothetical protein U0941_23625 [Planctomycetaceae bacterium]
MQKLLRGLAGNEFDPRHVLAEDLVPTSRDERAGAYKPRPLWCGCPRLSEFRLERQGV